MQVRDQLFRLVRLQGLVQETRAARSLVEDSPARIEEIENHYRERNAEYVAIRQRCDALEADRQTRSAELATLEESQKKYMADLMNVQNQREYAAMLKEIDAVKAQIGEHEVAILTDMEEIETAKADLAKFEEHIQAEREQVARERAEVEAAVERARKSIARLETERARIESELPKSLVSAVRRLEQGRQGQFLSKADEGVCQSCFVRVRPQGFQEVKLASKIHYCSNCKRLLYHEPSLTRMAAEAAGPGEESDATNPSSVQAADGGAV